MLFLVLKRTFLNQTRIHHSMSFVHFSFLLWLPQSVPSYLIWFWSFLSSPVLLLSLSRSLAISLPSVSLSHLLSLSLPLVSLSLSLPPPLSLSPSLTLLHWLSPSVHFLLFISLFLSLPNDIYFFSLPWRYLFFYNKIHLSLSLSLSFFLSFS